MTSQRLLLLVLAVTSHAYRYNGGDWPPNDSSNWWNDHGGPFGNNGGDDDDDVGSGFASGDMMSSIVGMEPATAARYIQIHGILAAVAFVLLFPLGSILVRVVPGRMAWIIHAITQSLAYLAYVASAALGLWLVTTIQFGNGMSMLQLTQINYHFIIGIVLLAVIFFQPVLGLIHHMRFKRLGRRTSWSYFHIWIGRLSITVGIVNGGLGLAIARAGRSAVIAYSVISAIMWLLWVAAALFGAYKRSKKPAAAPAPRRHRGSGMRGGGGSGGSGGGSRRAPTSGAARGRRGPSGSSDDDDVPGDAHGGWPLYGGPHGTTRAQNVAPGAGYDIPPPPFKEVDESGTDRSRSRSPSSASSSAPIHRTNTVSPLSVHGPRR